MTDMTKPYDGGPAFPTVAGQTVYSHGMTLRDWFAGQALAGLSSPPDATGSWSWQAKAAAREAYRMADAMLEARGK